VVEEARQHLAFALVRAVKFLSTTSTSKVESAAVEYLSGSGGGASTDTSTDKAFVIFGRSGARARPTCSPRSWPSVYGRELLTGPS
jgi:hypothetical protein